MHLLESLQDVSMYQYDLKSRIMNQRRTNAQHLKNREEGQAVFAVLCTTSVQAQSNG